MKITEAKQTPAESEPRQHQLRIRLPRVTKATPELEAAIKSAELEPVELILGPGMNSKNMTELVCKGEGKSPSQAARDAKKRLQKAGIATS